MLIKLVDKLQNKYIENFLLIEWIPLCIISWVFWLYKHFNGEKQLTSSSCSR